MTDAQPPYLSPRTSPAAAIDARLCIHELRCLRAWAGALVQVGVLSKSQTREVSRSLRGILRQVQERPEVLARAAEADFHGFIEARLHEEVGEAALRLWAGVSRGDLLSTVLRLDTAETLRRMRSAALDLGFELLRQCERNREVILPGFTHGQASQPILWSHFCLAYVEMVLRDVARLRGALERTLVLPLGSGALAGTSFPVDRERLAQRLGFREASDNSVDAVGDRDFVVETLAAASLLGQHAARLAQELLHLGSPAVGFLRLGEAGCTQADLLPQQRNATALELARVRASNLLGNQFQVQMLLRPLAGAYHRDLEEMAEPLRRSESDAVLCLRTLTGQLTDLELRPDACRQGTTTEFTTATDLANYLIGKGMPARTATATAREVVQRCRASGKDLHSLPLQEYQLICPLFEADLYEAVSADSSIGSRLVRGGTSPMVVAVALKRAEKRLLKAQAEL